MDFTIDCRVSNRPGNLTRLLALCCGLWGMAGTASASAPGAYPKIGLMFATQNANNLTPQQAARYDLVVDISWLAHQSNDYMAALRQSNPNFIGLMAQTLPYVNIADSVLYNAGFNEQYLCPPPALNLYSVWVLPNSHLFLIVIRPHCHPHCLLVSGVLVFLDMCHRPNNSPIWVGKSMNMGHYLPLRLHRRLQHCHSHLDSSQIEG